MTESGRRWEFEDEHTFLEKLREIVGQGVEKERIEVITPIPVHGVEEILGYRRSALRFFTLIGGLVGLAAGFALTIGTVLDWPIITGGKPLISIPPFIIIAFALTILLGSLASLVGWLLLARLPSTRFIGNPVEHENRFIILVEGMAEGVEA